MTAQAATEADNSTVITAYKGFDSDMRCRGFQFEVGKTYTHEGPVELCQSGFHACEEPFDCFTYYSVADGKFAAVELAGVSDDRDGDTKRVGSTITIRSMLTVADLVEAQIEWCRRRADDGGDGSISISSGTFSTSASSGIFSTSAISGAFSTSASSGDCSKSASSGDGSKSACSGNNSKSACDTNGFASVAGINGAVKGGAGSALSLGYVDAGGELDIAVAKVGKNGIKPDTWYRVNEVGKFVEVTP